MPYIKQEDRERLLNTTVEDLSDSKLSAGDINYIISIILKKQFFQSRCYATANILVGAVECAKLEFIRRYVNSYEDQKVIDNGDI